MYLAKYVQFCGENSEYCVWIAWKGFYNISNFGFSFPTLVIINTVNRNTSGAFPQGNFLFFPSRWSSIDVNTPVLCFSVFTFSIHRKRNHLADAWDLKECNIHRAMLTGVTSPERVCAGLPWVSSGITHAKEDQVKLPQESKAKFLFSLSQLLACQSVGKSMSRESQGPPKIPSRGGRPSCCVTVDQS